MTDQPHNPLDQARQQADQHATALLFAALHQSAEHDLTRVIQLADQWATRPDRADALRELNEALSQPAHNTGPSVRECAADNRAYWERKDAGEGQ